MFYDILSHIMNIRWSQVLSWRVHVGTVPVDVPVDGVFIVILWFFAFARRKAKTQIDVQIYKMALTLT